MQICKSFGTIELSVKYEKHSTRTNPEFGQTQGEIFKNPAKKVHWHSTGDESQKTINFGDKLSFILVFPFS
jgi:hypothetical protein